MSMPTASPFAADGLLYVGTGSQGDANRPFFAIKPGRRRRHHAHATARRATTSSPGASARVGLHAIGARRTTAARISSTTPASSPCSTRRRGKEIYKVRVGGGGHTFSASPVAAGNRVYLLTEGGVTFVLEAGDGYKEIAKNDLDEMSLASPAIAGDAIYIRTETKLYKIGG